MNNENTTSFEGVPPPKGWYSGTVMISPVFVVQRGACLSYRGRGAVYALASPEVVQRSCAHIIG